MFHKHKLAGKLSQVLENFQNSRWRPAFDEQEKCSLLANPFISFDCIISVVLQF